MQHLAINNKKFILIPVTSAYRECIIKDNSVAIISKYGYLKKVISMPLPEGNWQVAAVSKDKTLILRSF
jgi:hypothetical protein